MKKIIYLFLTIIITLSSCSKDDDAIDLNQQTINVLSSAHWTLTKETKGGIEQDRSWVIDHLHIYGYHEAGGTGVGYTSFVAIINKEEVTGSASWLYEVQNNGTIIIITVVDTTYEGVTNPCTDLCVLEMEIIEISENKYVVTYLDNDGATIVRTYEER